MKSSSQHLSNFQKDQYTIYLETQLQKFSAFMLTQKKQTQKNHILQQTIDNLTKNLTGIVQRVKLLEIYQRENHQYCQRIESQSSRTQQFDSRLQRVQSIYFQKSTKIPNSYIQKQNKINKINKNTINHTHQQLENKIQQIQQNINNLNLQMKFINHSNSNQSHKNQQNHQDNSKSYQNTLQLKNNDLSINKPITKSQLKKIQDKMLSVFDDKFIKIQKMIKKSLKNKQKHSPSLNSPINQKLSQKNISDQTFIAQSQFSVPNYIVNFNKNQKNQDKQNDYGYKNSTKNQSYSISQTSQKLLPITYKKQSKNINTKSIIKNKKQKSRSNSKSYSKSHSKSLSKSKNQSKSINKSKINLNQQNIKNNDNHSKYSTHSTKNNQKLHKIYKNNHHQNIENQKSVSKSRSKSAKSTKSVKSIKTRQSQNNLSPKPLKKSKISKYYQFQQYKMNCKKNHEF